MEALVVLLLAIAIVTAGASAAVILVRTVVAYDARRDAFRRNHGHRRPR